MKVSDVALTHLVQLGMKALSDSAFADIKNKLSLDNAVDEVLSRASVR